MCDLILCYAWPAGDEPPERAARHEPRDCQQEPLRPQGQEARDHLRTQGDRRYALKLYLAH